MADYPFENRTLKQCASRIDNKRFWDGCSSEWNDSTCEEKLLELGDFVLKGGNLNDVLKQYAERHDEMYRPQIQRKVLYYICILMTGKYWDCDDVLCNRIKRLDKEELVQLLTEELRRNVKKSCSINRYGTVDSYWAIGQEHLNDDSILEKIESEHWRNHPEESFDYYLRRSEFNWDYSRSLW